MLWEVLKKFGVPAKVIQLLKSLHQRVKVKINVEGIIHTIYSIIVAKQGKILGPVIFTFYAHAIMMSSVARSVSDFVLTGRSYRACGQEYPAQILNM